MPFTTALAWAYPLAFWTHIAPVIAAVGLFTARGLVVLAGHVWPSWRPSPCTTALWAGGPEA